MAKKNQLQHFQITKGKFSFSILYSIVDQWKTLIGADRHLYLEREKTSLYYTSRASSQSFSRAFSTAPTGHVTSREVTSRDLATGNFYTVDSNTSRTRTLGFFIEDDGATLCMTGRLRPCLCRVIPSQCRFVVVVQFYAKKRGVVCYCLIKFNTLLYFNCGKSKTKLTFWI